MPIGIEQWRAGIASPEIHVLRKIAKLLPMGCIVSDCICSIAYLYLFIWASVVTTPISIITAGLLYYSLDSVNEKVLCIQDPFRSYMFVTPLVIVHMFFMATMTKHCVNLVVTKFCLYRKHFIRPCLFAMQIGLCLAYLQSVENLLLLSGDIETNPGPEQTKILNFCHWNLNSICARNQIKLSLLEAYNSIHHLDVIALSETMMDSTISSDQIIIEGFSNEIYRNDHPSNTKIGEVCLYYREELPIKRRKEFQLLQEMIVTEVSTILVKILGTSHKIALLQSLIQCPPLPRFNVV